MSVRYDPTIVLYGWEGGWYGQDAGSIRDERTVPSCTDFNADPSASYPTMRAMSCTRVCASRHPVFAERSCESLAWRHGWTEMCALFGRSVDAMVDCLDGVMFGDLEVWCGSKDNKTMWLLQLHAVVLIGS